VHVARTLIAIVLSLQRAMRAPCGASMISIQPTTWPIVGSILVSYLSPGTYNGSSGSSGERTSDLEEEVLVITEPVGREFDDRDLVVDPFEQAGVKRPTRVGDNPCA
jgi:hypothetical protein